MGLRKVAIFLLIGGVLFSAVTKAQEARLEAEDLLTAEKFITAFYSFDPDKLQPHLSNAVASEPSVSYCQGWAKGGNYIVLNRQQCVFDEPQTISCSITVRDDLARTLDLDFDVTDTFHLSVVSGTIASIKFTSDDPPIFLEALDWVKANRPELFKEACRGYFDGGPTPEKCVRVFVRGFKDFAEDRNATVE